MKEIAELLKELSIAEKAALLEGYHTWWTNAVPRLGIPAVHMTDGPLGVREKADGEGAGAMELGQSLPSTAFPAPVCIANGWSEENAEKVGHAIGEECVGYGIDVLLAPGLNLKRDPRCGRNFEYYSEDPLLAGKMAAAYTRGLQATGVAACAKHFALNNNENMRYMGDSTIDERAARELYLKAFEICVKEGKPRAMMCAYNQFGGSFCSENKWLLTDVLREEWGYEGLVMSDWGATHDRVEGVKAGLDLDMPGGIWANRKAIIEAAESGELSMETLDKAVSNVLRLVCDAQSGKKSAANTEIAFKEHNALAIDIAADCAVLLKNDGALPLSAEQKVFVVGELFEKMRYQGAGSSLLEPAMMLSPKNAFDAAGVSYEYVRGYREAGHDPEVKLENEALRACEGYETVLFFGGLTELFESEGFDRENILLPPNQLSLINRLCRMGKKVVVILFGGSPVELPFADDVNAVLNMFLPGQGGGEACRRLLYGEANPSGRLSETWMRKNEDIPFGESYAKKRVEQYRENIFMGYRYFDEAPEKIRYPFGFGLSYTDFEYRDLRLEHENGRITAQLTVENTGKRRGAEVVQLYVCKNEGSAVFKASKELKAFCKLYLAVGEARTITLGFDESELSYYNTREQAWITENGSYEVCIGASSRDIRLKDSITVSGKSTAAAPYSEQVLAEYANIAECRISDAVFAETLGREIPAEPAKTPITLETPLIEYNSTRMGRLIYSIITKVFEINGRSISSMPEGTEREAAVKNQRFLMALMPRNSIRSLCQSSGGAAQMKLADGIVALANGRVARGAGIILKKDSPQPLPVEEKKRR